MEIRPTSESKYGISALSINFFADEKMEVDYLFVFDQDSVADKVGALTSAIVDDGVKGRITDLGMGPDTVIGGRQQHGGITFGDLETVEANLGSGNDHITVDYSTFWQDHPTRQDKEHNPIAQDVFYTLTMLNTGSGNDVVTVRLEAGKDGAFALDTETGDDKVYAGESTLPLIVFGGEGSDEIHGGGGNDIIFGDVGRIDYWNQYGEIVTRLGHSWAANPKNPSVTSASDGDAMDPRPRLVDIKAPGSGFPFARSYGSLVGLVVQAISPDGEVQYRRIVDNTDRTLYVDREWDAGKVPDSTYFYRISVMPEDQTDGQFRPEHVIWSINQDLGGNDTMYGGGGEDILIGGGR